MYRFLFFAFALLCIQETNAQSVSITATYLGGFHPSDSTTDNIDKTYKDKYGNVYCIGRSTLAFVSKSNPNGELEWIEFIPPNAVYTHYPTDIAVDDSGFVYVVGNIGSVSGTLVWFNVYDVNGLIIRGGTLSSTSSAIIAGANHQCFYIMAAQANGKRVVRKIGKTSGTSWIRPINDAQGALYSLVADSSENLYAILSSTSKMVLIKYSSAGVTLDSMAWTPSPNPIVNIGGNLRSLELKGNFLYVLTDLNSQGTYTHLYKIDTGLNLIWKNEFKWQLNSWGKVCSDDSANHYVVTKADSSAWGFISRTAIWKIEPDSGKRVWERYFYQPDGYHYTPAFTTSDSTGLYIVGDKFTYNASDSSTYLLKYDFQGNLLYSKITNHTNHAQLKGIHINGNKLITVLHANENAATKQDMILSFTNTYDTAEVDRIRYDTHQSGNHITRDIAQDNAGNLYTVGNTYNKTYRCTGAYVRKTDSAGNLIWTRSFRGNSHSIAIDTANQLVWVVAASDTLGNAPEHLIVNKYDYNGNVVCSKIMRIRYDGDYIGILKVESKLDYNNDLIIHGMGLYWPNRRLFLTKVGANCDTLWVQQLGVSVGKVHFNHSIYIDPTNAIDTYSETSWIRFSPNGTILKSYSYGNGGVLAAKSYNQDSVYYVYRYGNLLFRYKTGSNSATWVKSIGYFNVVADNEYLDMITDSKDNIYILVAAGPDYKTCTTIPGDYSYYRDVYLVKASAQGDSIWKKKIGTNRLNYYNNLPSYYYSYYTGNYEEFKEYQVDPHATTLYLNNAGNLVLCTALINDSVCAPGYNSIYNAYPASNINILVLDTSGNILTQKIIDNSRHLWDMYQASLFNKSTGNLTLVGASQSKHGWLEGVGYNLIINDANGPCTVNSVLNSSLCQGSYYHFNGQNLTAPGAYKDTLTSSTGCDSIITLNLQVKPTATGTVTASICPGGAYQFNGQTLTTPGAYKDTLTSSTGCDSILTLNLQIKPTTTGNLSKSICTGGSYFFNGQNLTAAGVYKDTLTASNGCDSVVTLNLQVNALITNTVNAAICQGNSYYFNGVSLTAPGTYKDTLTAQGGCDSIVTLSLQVSNVLQQSVSATLCPNEAYSFNGQSLTAAGVYLDTLVSSGGCDSVVQLTLTAATDYDVTVDTAIQQGTVYVLPSGISVSAAGIYMDTLQSSGGCDSIITTNLSVISSITNAGNLSFDITVYPNPATNELYIDAGGNAISSVLIYNTIGSLVSIPQQPNNRLDISTLPGGIYIAQITAGGVTKKLRWVKL